MSLVLWSLFLAVLLFVLRAVVAPLHKTAAFKLVFLPGVLASVLFRLLSGLAVRAPIKAVNPPWRDGEPVEHDRSPIQFIGVGVLAVVPFVSALGLILYLHALLHPTFRGVQDLPRLEANASAASAVAQASTEVLQDASAFAVEVRGDDWKAFLFLYLAAAILVYAAPPFRELRVLLLCLGFLLLPVIAVDWLGLEPGFFSRAWFIRRSFSPMAYQVIAMLFSLTFLTMLVAGTSRLSLSIVRTAMPRKRSEKKK